MSALPGSIDVVYHFAACDTDCSSDYLSVEIKFDGEQVVEYGDACHDRGREKVQGWLDCLVALWSDMDLPEPVESSVADGERCFACEKCEAWCEENP